MQDDLEELAGRSRSDPDAFGALYDRLYDQVWRYARAHTGNDATADDITADVFLEAYRSIHRYRRRGGGIRAWLLRIARNDIIDHFRHLRRSRIVALGEAADLPALDATEDVAIARADAARLSARLGELTPDQREVLFLRFAADLSIEEVAKVVKRSVGAVKQLQHRALRALEGTNTDA